MEFVNTTNPGLAGFGSEYAKRKATEYQPEDYAFEGQDGLITPAMVFYEDLIRENIKKAVYAARGSEHLITHIKTHKTAEIVKIGLELGISKVMAATIAEAELAASCGVSMVVVSYSMVGPNIKRFLALQAAFPSVEFICLADDEVQLVLLDKAAGEQNRSAQILIDVNPGLNRTGVDPDEIETLAKAADAMEHIILRGINFYDLNDRALDPTEFRKAVFAQDDMIVRHYECLKAQYASVDMLIVGGTPEMEYHVAYPYDDMYYSPGTMALYDWTYASNFPSMDYRPAAMILSRVISHPAKGYFTLDCGTKAISQDTRTTNGLLLGINHAQPIAQNEEHWVFRMEDGFEEERPAIGQEIFIMPAHICPNMIFYPYSTVVRDGHIVACWSVAARDRVLTI